MQTAGGLEYSIIGLHNASKAWPQRGLEKTLIMPFRMLAYAVPYSHSPHSYMKQEKTADAGAIAWSFLIFVYSFVYDLCFMP